VRQDADYATVRLHLLVREHESSSWELRTALLKFARVQEQWQLTNYGANLVDPTEEQREAEQSAREADWTHIQMLSDAEGWLIGNSGYGEGRSGGVLSHYLNGKWQPVKSEPGTPFSTFHMSSAEEGWIIEVEFRLSTKSATTLWHYRDTEWQEIEIRGEYDISAMDFTSPTDGWAVGGGIIMRYTDGEWQEVGAEIADIEWHTTLADVQMISPTEGWAVGAHLDNKERAAAWHYDGATWQEVEVPDTYPLSSVHFTSPTEGWAVGGVPTTVPRDAVILRFQNGRWVHMPSPAQGMLNSVFAVSSDEAWAVGSNGLLLHYKDGQWSREDWSGTQAGSTAVASEVSQGGDSPDLNDVYMTSPGRSGWIVGDRGTILRYDDGAEGDGTWSSYIPQP
jgi:photosystem II stability/assembly factor-like uncharacterized protein